MKAQIQPIYVGTYGGGNIPVFSPPPEATMDILPSPNSKISRVYPCGSQLCSQIEIVKVQVDAPGGDGEAKIIWAFLNEENIPAVYGMLQMTPEEYDGWSSDNPYLLDLVIDRLGLTAI